MAYHLPTDFGIRKLAKVIDNTGPLPKFLSSIERFAGDMVRCENALLVPAVGVGR